MNDKTFSEDYRLYHGRLSQVEDTLKALVSDVRRLETSVVYKAQLPTALADAVNHVVNRVNAYFEDLRDVKQRLRELEITLAGESEMEQNAAAKSVLPGRRVDEVITELCDRLETVVDRLEGFTVETTEEVWRIRR